MLTSTQITTDALKKCKKNLKSVAEQIEEKFGVNVHGIQCSPIAPHY